MDQAILKMIMVENLYTQNEIQEGILETYGVRTSRSTVCRSLGRMNITRKKLTLVSIERNIPERIGQRRAYALELSRISDNNLIFLDESGFNQHTRRTRGYSLANTRAYITVPANRNKNRSLMCVISKEGVVGYEYRNGPYNTELFICFIERGLIPYSRIHPNAILVMDNGRIHKTAGVLRTLRENNIPFKFNIPYSPELNSIEEFFSMVKSRFCTKRMNSPEMSIEECLDQFLGYNNDFFEQLSGFYSNMRNWLDKAERGEYFI